MKFSTFKKIEKKGSTLWSIYTQILEILAIMSIRNFTKKTSLCDLQVENVFLK